MRHSTTTIASMMPQANETANSYWFDSGARCTTIVRSTRQAVKQRSASWLSTVA